MRRGRRVGKERQFQYVDYIPDNNVCKHVIFSEKAFASIISQTLSYSQNETGGVLIGYILGGIWYVLDVIDAGIKTENTPIHFTWDQNYVNHVVETQKVLYKYMPTIVGFYHRHPGSLDYFSLEDMDTMSEHLKNCRYGLLSGLVNIDPDFRITLYFAFGNNLMSVNYDVGNEYFPEDLLAYADVKILLERYKDNSECPKKVNYKQLVRIDKIEERGTTMGYNDEKQEDLLCETMRLKDEELIDYVEKLERKTALKRILIPEILYKNPDYVGPLYGYERKDSGKYVVLGYEGNVMPECLGTELIGYSYGQEKCKWKRMPQNNVDNFIVCEKGEWKIWNKEVRSYEAVDIEIYTLTQNLFSRNSGLLETDWLKESTVIIAGVGSVGSLIALQLARSGVGNFILFDQDIVEIHNVCRHQCGISDVGRYKVDAVEDRLVKINPNINVIKFKSRFQDVPLENYVNAIKQKQCIMIGTADNRIGNAYVSDVAYELGIPFASIGFLERAWACEIFTALPERGDSCYRCTFKTQIDNAIVQEHNRHYLSAEGQAQVTFEPGLDVDIETGVSIFDKIVLDILNRNNSEYHMRIYDSLTQYTMIAGTEDITDSFWKQYLEPMKPVSIDLKGIQCSCGKCKIAS